MENHGVLEHYKTTWNSGAKSACLLNGVVSIGGVVTSMVLHEKGIINDKQYFKLGLATFVTSVALLSKQMALIGGSIMCEVLENEITD